MLDGLVGGEHNQPDLGAVADTAVQLIGKMLPVHEQRRVFSGNFLSDGGHDDSLHLLRTVWTRPF